MGKIFYIMGKSASGKDKIHEILLADKSLSLSDLILYTTRPIRSGETDGQHYHFVDEKTLDGFRAKGKVIEERTYQTIAGPWTYCTVDEGLDLENTNYLAIGTLVSYQKLRSYYGEDRVLPIYLSVSDENLLLRAMKRERKQAEPKYQEMCRRFLADSEDFSEEKIRGAGISRRFANNGELEDCISEIRAYISTEIAKATPGKRVM